MREREGRRGENEGGRCGGTLGNDEVGMDGFPSRTMGVSEGGRAAGGRVEARTESFWVLCCPITVMVLNTLRLSLPLCLVRSQEGRHVAHRPTLFFMPHCEGFLYDNVRVRVYGW